MEFEVYKRPLLGIIDDFIDGDGNEATEEYDCTDTMWGVFKVYAFFSYTVSYKRPSLRPNVDQYLSDLHY